MGEPPSQALAGAPAGQPAKSAACKRSAAAIRHAAGFGWGAESRPARARAPPGRLLRTGLWGEGATAASRAWLQRRAAEPFEDLSGDRLRVARCAGGFGLGRGGAFAEEDRLQEGARLQGRADADRQGAVARQEALQFALGADRR